MKVSLKNFLSSEVEGIISSINEYAIYVKLGEFDIDGFLHANDLSHLNNPDEELKNLEKETRLK